MKKVWKWILLALGIALVCFIVALAAFRPFMLNHFRIGQHAAGFPRAPFMGMMGMLFFGLIRVAVILAVLGFAVYGIVALFRRTPHTATAASQTSLETVETQSPARICVKCSKPLEQDWKNCPFCGKKQ